MLSLSDVLVVCPLEVEFKAIENRLIGMGLRIHREAHDNEQCKSMLGARIRGGESTNSCINVCVVQSQHQGVLRAACLASVLIAELRPKLVISFGIAGLFDSNDFSLGDVCIPETIYYYEPAKDAQPLRPGSRHSRIDALNPASHSQRLAAAIAYPCARGSYALPDARFNFRAVVDRPMASGEKLIAAVGSLAREEAIAIHRHMVGVDMEAAGVAEACRSAPQERRPQFLAVKGFSDLATQKSKNPRDKAAKARQLKERKTAANNAAEYMTKFLEKNCERIESEPPADRNFDSSKLNKKLSQFKQILTASTRMDWLPEDIRISHAIVATNVPVVYHFTVGSDGLISWVDMYFLLILRELRDTFRFRPHILISEPPDDEPSYETRERVEDLLGRLFSAKSFAVWWSSNIETVNSLHRYYAERHRCVPSEYFQSLYGANVSTHGDGWHLHKTDRWLIFLIWMSRVMPTQVILAFEKRRELYEKLREVPGLEAIIVYGTTFKLSSDPSLWSRFDSRVRSLGITSDSVQPLLDWFNGELRRSVDTGCELITRFTEYFAPLNGKSASEVTESTQRVSAIVQTLTSGIKHLEARQCAIIECLANLVHRWEREFVVGTS
jgi:nucleoside phosphorylase